MRSHEVPKARTAPDRRAEHWLADLWTDLRYTLRQIRRTPGPTGFVIATLAVGIGATVTMAGVIDRLLLRPPHHVQSANRLARVVFQRDGLPAGGFVSYPLFLDIQSAATAFEATTAFASIQRLPLGNEPDAPEIAGTLVSPSYFSVLGVRAAIGRTFTMTDGFTQTVVAGGPPLAVLSYQLWQRSFGGDSAIVGRALRIGKMTYTVVGVAPDGFQGLGPDPSDVWLPLNVAADAEVRAFALEDRGMSWLTVIGRLRGGVARATAEAQVTPIIQREAGRALASSERLRVVAASIIRGRGPDAPREVRVALWLSGISAVVLVIACANVANLLLARAFMRRREIAARIALGASVGRLSRQMLTEGVVLASLGGGAALALAGAGGGMMRHFFLRGADGPSGFVDARLFMFAAAIALGTGLLVSLAPLSQTAVADLGHTLRTGSAVGGGRTGRARTLLLSVQAALCMLLLVLAGLFAQSFRRVDGIDLGMDPDRTLRAFFDIGGAMARHDRDAMYAELRERVAAIPGVERVAYVAGGGLRAVNVHTAERNADESIRRTQDVPYEIAVDSGYFRTLGSSLRGRDFSSADVRGAPRAAIINEPLARLLFPGEDALGRCIFLPIRSTDPNDACWTVVGVLHGFWYARSILKREGLLVYVPIAQRVTGPVSPQQMVISASGSPGPIGTAVREAIRQVRPDAPRIRVQVMSEVLEPELRPWQLSATMFSLFGLVALVIAAVGLYAVVAFASAQRSEEIAVRMALGAQSRHVLGLVAYDALRAVVAGLVVGLVAALALRSWIGPLLFQTSPSDPAIMAGVATLLLFVAGIAVFIPTRRALRSDPAAILRLD